MRESDGKRLWTTNGLAVGNPVTLAGSIVVVSTACGLVYDAASGHVVKHFDWYGPAFGYGEAVHAVTPGNGDLTIEAFDPLTMRRRSSFDERDGTTQPPLGETVPPLGTTPLLADGYVFAAGGRGQIWALDRSSGAVVWHDDTGAAMSFYGYDPLPGLSAGDGYLLVASQAGLTAWRGSGAGPGKPPRISHLRLSRTRFAVGRGTVFSFRLSTAATVTIAVRRASCPTVTIAVRRASCPTVTIAVRRASCRHASCSVMIASGPEPAGRDRVAFSGRIAGSALRPGRYRAVLVARAADGRRSRRHVLTFAVVAR